MKPALPSSFQPGVLDQSNRTTQLIRGWFLAELFPKKADIFHGKFVLPFFFERPHGGAGLSLGVSYSWCFNPASNTSFHWDLLDFSLPSTVSSCLLCSVPRCLHYIWWMNLMHFFFSKTSSFFGYLAAAQVTRTLLTVTPRKAREAWTPSKQGAVGVILSKSKNLPVPLVGQRPPKYHNDTSQVGIAFAYEGDQGMFIRDMYIYVYIYM